MSTTFDFEKTAEVQRAQQEAAALERAQLHAEVFLRHPAGKKILEEWDSLFLKKRVPMNALHTEYAATEAVRSFVQAIHDCLEMAQKGLSKK